MPRTLIPARSARRSCVSPALSRYCRSKLPNARRSLRCAACGSDPDTPSTRLAEHSTGAVITHVANCVGELRLLRMAYRRAWRQDGHTEYTRSLLGYAWQRSSPECTLSSIDTVCPLGPRMILPTRRICWATSSRAHAGSSRLSPSRTELEPWSPSRYSTIAPAWKLAQVWLIGGLPSTATRLTVVG